MIGIYQLPSEDLITGCIGDPPVTARKTREAKIVATEDAVFGYRPPSAGKFLNSSDKPDDDEEDLLSDSEPTYTEARTIKITLGELKKVIRRAADKPNRRF